MYDFWMLFPILHGEKEDLPETAQFPDDFHILTYLNHYQAVVTLVDKAWKSDTGCNRNTFPALPKT
jgi:hypothetical protein